MIVTKCIAPIYEKKGRRPNFIRQEEGWYKDIEAAKAAEERFTTALANTTNYQHLLT